MENNGTETSLYNKEGAVIFEVWGAINIYSIEQQHAATTITERKHYYHSIYGDWLLLYREDVQPGRVLSRYGDDRVKCTTTEETKISLLNEWRHQNAAEIKLIDQILNMDRSMRLRSTQMERT